jgi:hypothetical protein
MHSARPWPIVGHAAGEQHVGAALEPGMLVRQHGVSIQQGLVDADRADRPAVPVHGIVHLHGHHLRPECLGQEFQDRRPLRRRQIHPVQGIEPWLRMPAVHLASSRRTPCRPFG